MLTSDSVNILSIKRPHLLLATYIEPLNILNVEAFSISKSKT